MGRQRRPFKRLSGLRDSRLIVIATEGRNTEKAYFETLVSREYFYNPRVHVEVITNQSNKSAPIWIYDNLMKFKKEYQLEDDDRLYLVIDRDHWGANSLADIARQCIQQNIGLMMSNPCFELWILLHVLDITLLSSAEQKKLLQNQRVNSTRNYLDQKICDCLGGYNKGKPNFSKIIPYIRQAVSNAKKSDINPEERWPNNLTTRIYRIIEELGIKNFIYPA